MDDFLLSRDFQNDATIFRKHITRVKLMAQNYTANADNPVVGSEYECEGTVIGIKKRELLPIKVAWDNGSINEYYAHNLIKVGEIESNIKDIINPNQAFRLKQGKRMKPKNKLYGWKEVDF